MNPRLPNPNNTSVTGDAPHAQTPGALDRILLDDAILPSSGFAASVMDAIAAEASAPAPIPFPWKFALPILAAIILALTAAIRFVLQLHQYMAAHPSLAHLDLTWLTSHTLTGQSLAATAAIAGALLSLVLTRYLALGRSSR